MALRQFPQLHTNPVNVLVGGKPIRASPGEREVVRRGDRAAVAGARQPEDGAEASPRRSDAEAEKTFQKAIEMYKKIAAEAPEGS